MKLDRWTYFNLPADVRQLVDAFGSPESECSFLKDVPVNAVDQVRPALKIIRQLTGRRTHIKYRGPRHDWGRSTCLKRHARRFAVYFR